jgi:beta-1,2-mannobiose phosphorylase / 1,2-beta-oligomannan phosphorylase
MYIGLPLSLCKTNTIMIEVVKHGILLEKTTHGFENEGVLNPAAIRVGDKVHLFYRAVSKGNYSSIGFCLLDSPLTIESRMDIPLVFPQAEYESHGVEDPRITKIDDLFYLTYTAYDGVNAMGALAISTDLQHFDKQGIIVPQVVFGEFYRLATSQKKLNEKYTRFNDRDRLFSKPDKNVLLWDKNLVFFPRRINDKLHFLHRIRPDIQIVAVQELSELTTDFWAHYFLHFQDNIVLTSKYKHEVSYIGGGCPPIETEQGWLLIYHGVCDTPKGYIYSACAALLDLENPQKEIARLPFPLFKPEQDWELKGEVNNVCFPTGAVVFDDTLYIYYGAADERIACASLSLSFLLETLLSHQ